MSTHPHTVQVLIVDTYRGVTTTVHPTKADARDALYVSVENDWYPIDGPIPTSRDAAIEAHYGDNTGEEFALQEEVAVQGDTTNGLIHVLRIDTYRGTDISAYATAEAARAALHVIAQAEWDATSGGIPAHGEAAIAALYANDCEFSYEQTGATLLKAALR